MELQGVPRKWAFPSNSRIPQDTNTWSKFNYIEAHGSLQVVFIFLQRDLCYKGSNLQVQPWSYFDD